MQNLTTTQNRVADADIHNLFQVEELELRLENAWPKVESVEPTYNPEDGTISCKISFQC